MYVAGYSALIAIYKIPCKTLASSLYYKLSFCLIITVFFFRHELLCVYSPPAPLPPPFQIVIAN